MAKRVFECCICGNFFEGYGNNPDGAMWLDKDGNVVEGEFKPDSRCCDDCNNVFVIPGRMYKLAKNRKEADEK